MLSRQFSTTLKPGVHYTSLQHGSQIHAAADVFELLQYKVRQDRRCQSLTPTDVVSRYDMLRRRTCDCGRTVVAEQCTLALEEMTFKSDLIHRAGVWHSRLAFSETKSDIFTRRRTQTYSLDLPGVCEMVELLRVLGERQCSVAMSERQRGSPRYPDDSARSQRCSRWGDVKINSSAYVTCQPKHFSSPYVPRSTCRIHERG